MNKNYYFMKTKILLLALTSLGLTGCAALKTSEPRPVVMQAAADQDSAEQEVTPPVASVAVSAPAPSSTVAEVQQLIQARQVTELRTSYNGQYGASLLFNRDSLTYYAALFQQQTFWRVIKTQDVAHAERLYRSFIAETARLADVDLRRIRLAAEHAHTEKQLGEQSAELRALENDLQSRRQQESLIASHQAVARQEAEQLAEQQQQAQEQLRALKKQIKALEAQQAAISDTSSKGKSR